MKKMRLFSAFFLAIMLFSIVASGCNFPLDVSQKESSFDQAMLLMIASRGALELYSDSTQSTSAALEMNAKLGEIGRLQSTLEQMNQHNALASEYQRIADMAAQTGNQVLADKFNEKVQLHSAEAQRLEARRAEWRRRHRFFTAIGRGVRKFGRAIANILNFGLSVIADNITARIEFYVNEIRAFLRNPLRYTFDLALNRQLDIIKNQLNDRLGPFWGRRAYDLIKVDQAAWGVERQIFDRATKAKTTEAVIVTESIATEAPADSGGQTEVYGNWHGAQCDEAEGTFQYKWSVDLIRDPDTDQLVGTIKFHACPGGGRVLYRVIGEPQMGTTITLNGIKKEGGGDLYANSPDNVTFTFDTKKKKITPNYSQ